MIQVYGVFHKYPFRDFSAFGKESRYLPTSSIMEHACAWVPYSYNHFVLRHVVSSFVTSYDLIISITCVSMFLDINGKQLCYVCC